MIGYDKQEKPPCVYCGKVSYRSGVCNTCRTRIRRHGTPSPKVELPRRLILLFSEPGGGVLNGPEESEP